MTGQQTTKSCQHRLPTSSSSSIFSAGQRFALHSRTCLRVVESTTRYTFPVQTGGIFYFPWHRHQVKGSFYIAQYPVRWTAQSALH